MAADRIIELGRGLDGATRELPEHLELTRGAFNASTDHGRQGKLIFTDLQRSTHTMHYKLKDLLAINLKSPVEPLSCLTLQNLEAPKIHTFRVSQDQIHIYIFSPRSFCLVLTIYCISASEAN